MALGKSGVTFNLEKLSIKFGDILIVQNGKYNSSYNESEAADYMRNDNIEINVDLYSGSKKSSKESKVDFKMKLMENKKSRSFSGIDYLKTYKIDMINNYLYKGQTIIKEKIGKNENFYNFSGKDSKFRVKALTVLMEYTYRYYDRIKYDTKRWFLDSIETIITKQSGTVLI